MAVAGRIFGPELRPYSDPATEFQVIRLTDPGFASGFSAPWQRHFTRRGEMLYWSDRAGSRQAFLMDLRSGDSRQMTEADALDPRSITLTQDDRTLVFADGDTIHSRALSSERSRELHRLATGSSCRALTVAANGIAFIAESGDGKTKIVENGARGSRTLRELSFEIDWLMVRPRRPQLLFRSGDRFALLDMGGRDTRDLHLAAGKTGEALWIPSGRTVVYLHIPDTAKELITLRENEPDANSDKLIAKTSQYASIAPNADASVFVGASRSKASSYVLLLVRAVRRELALCEHHASDPTMVRPMFSPDSQSVFFSSDRDGKPALYRVHVEKFVDETSEDQ